MHWKARRNGAWFRRRADVQQSLGQMQDRRTFISAHDGFRIPRLVKSPPQCLVIFPSVPGLSPGLSIPHELGAPRSLIHGNFGALYPIYVRGEACLAAKQGPEAAAEFQKILAHRGIVVSDPIGAVARLQLGRAYALSGDTAKAKSAYQDFLALWKDADPDIPMLKQAKTEYAQLK